MELDHSSVRPSRAKKKVRSDDDTAVATQPLVKKEEVDSDDDGSYRPRPPLQEGSVCMRRLIDLIKFLDAGVIDVDPEYQREVVWTAERMTGLINSLMENFYIPPIILNKKPQPDPHAKHQYKLVCVDGKQRLSSVLAFVKGIIPCHDHRGEQWWFCEAANGKKNRRVISEHQQRQFYSKELVSTEYDNLSPEQEEDLFARVQMGVQLNLAEKMRASTGPWQELARLFVEDFPSVYDLIKNRARSKDFQLTLSCFSQIVECMHPTAANGIPILKTNHTHLPKFLSNKAAVDDGIKSHLASVWNTFEELIKDDPDTFTNGNKYLQGVQTFAPVEMVGVTVLISIHSENRNNRLLLGDIQAMRTAVRGQFIDLRLNIPVWKWYWDYIEDLEAIRGAVDGSTVNRKTKQKTKKTTAASSQSAAPASTAASITAVAAASKRGRTTVRTKRQAPANSEEGTIAVQQDTATSKVLSTKRQRTDGTSSSGQNLLVSQIQPLFPLTTRILPTSMEPPTQNDSPVVRRGPRTHGSTSSAPPSEATKDNSSNPTDTETLQRYSRTPVEARQQPVSTLNGFQSAHRANNNSPANDLSASPGSLAAAEPRAPTAPMVPRYGNPRPVRGPPQVGGAQDSWRSATRAAPQLQSIQTAKPSLPQYSRQQLDGIIDLTDDTEQERQDLLSSFKDKPKNP